MRKTIEGFSGVGLSGQYPIAQDCRSPRKSIPRSNSRCWFIFNALRGGLFSPE